MSTFGLLNTAYSGLNAARAALEVTGQNVSNVNTPGYTRQRVDQTSVPGLDLTSRFTTGLNIGQGTKVTGISRLADALVDARVRDTASTSGYWTAASSALSGVEDSLGEPGDTGLSSTLTDFWDAWGAMSTKPTDTPTANALLGSAKTLTDRIAAGYSTAQAQWTSARTGAASSVATINTATAQIASLNDQIMRLTASGANANELIDQRSAAITTLAGLTGATTRDNGNGSVDVIIGGSTIVSGTTPKTLELNPANGAALTAVGLRFKGTGSAVQVDGGTLAAQLSSLGPDGAYKQAADAYDAVATALTTKVNGVIRAAFNGDTTHDFFSSDATKPAALGLSVRPTSISGIATSTPDAGSDGKLADTISELGSADGSPDKLWSSYVSGLGALSKAASTQASVASSASTAATTAQTSQSGVDLDEETANLVLFQHAYQGAARVMTAIDQMLDTLINHTGIVGT